MGLGLVKNVYMRGKAPPLPRQSYYESKGEKLVDPTLQTFFTAYKVPIGIEIEVESFDRYTWPRCIYWSVKDDNSLRDNGAELVSVPIAGKNIDYALYELDTAMKNTQRPRWSHRCSVHVHINVRNWTVEQYQNLVGTYVIFEDLFFSLVPPERKAGSYAYPMRDISPENAMPGDEVGKYCALNIGSSTGDYGTVEFRHSAGTADPRQLRRWIQLIVKLHAYVRKTPIEELRRTIYSLNTNSEYMKFLETVFGKTAQIFPPTLLQNSMERGVLWSKIYFWGLKDDVRDLRDIRKDFRF